MRIRSVHIKNFRSIKDAELSFGPLTALVGRNGAGKSTFLHALNIFYGPSMQVIPEDYFAGDDTQEIEIAITYEDLDAWEQKVFAPYIDSGSLTVARMFSLANPQISGRYFGLRQQHPDFEHIKRLRGKADRRKAFNDFVDANGSSPYSELQRVRRADEADEAMLAWERAHQDLCQQSRDDGQFFGWSGVGRGRLDRFTRFIHVPAVRDAADDATEQRGSAITELMNILVRHTLDNNDRINALKDRARAEYSEIMNEDASQQLTLLQQELTNTLRSFIPESGVTLRWNQIPELSIPDPQTDVQVEEDGYVSAVARSGHGLQRAFILAVLQQLATAHAPESPAVDEEDPVAEESQDDPSQEGALSVVLAIEEPEIYQHPSRQRHLASVLWNLSRGALSGAMPNTQVLYTTHSPHFVGLDRFDQIRALRKEPANADEPLATCVRSTTMDVVANELEKATGSEVAFTAESLKARLQAVMTPIVNEGFFADVAVLVEGETDRSAIVGTARAMNLDLDAEGIAVIPCGGKTNIDRPLVVFRSLRIPTYVVWDADKEGHDPKPDVNRRLLRMHGREEDDWPAYVDEASACFERDLEHTVRAEIGAVTYDELRATVRQHFGLRSGEGEKNAMVMQRIIERAAAQGARSETIQAIVENILVLRQRRQA